jgi:hypothetical protein
MRRGAPWSLSGERVTRYDTRSALLIERYHVYSDNNNLLL